MRVTSTTDVYVGPSMTVREDTVRRPDGSDGIYAVVETADIAVVVPMDDEHVYLVEQHRHPVGRRSREFPSGTREPGDADATALAARELREETGLRARDLTLLGVLDTTPSTLTQRCSVYLATGLQAGPPDPGGGEQDLRTVRVRRPVLEQMIRDGALVDAKSLAAYALVLLHERAGTGSAGLAMPDRP